MQKEKLEDEKNVANVAYYLLLLGLLISLVLIIVGFVQSEKHSFTTSSSINWDMVVGGVILAFCTISVWGVLLMLSNISITLKNEFVREENPIEDLDNAPIIKQEDSNDMLTFKLGDRVIDTQTGETFYIGGYTRGKYKCYSDKELSKFEDLFSRKRLEKYNLK